MPKTSFYGRQKELDTLNTMLNRKAASFIVIKGRRRIGKSTLLKKFSKLTKKAYFFSGIAPTKHTTAQSQRDEFARQLQSYFDLPPIKANDWGDLFSFLAKQTSNGHNLIILDEITWMGCEDPEFLSKLQGSWELYFRDNPKLILIVCGSVSAWIEKNILSSTGFMGRPSLIMTLHQLPLPICVKFWRNKIVSSYEKLKILAITGGIPRYLELIDPSRTAEQNIHRLCFHEDGILVDEFDRIFSDLFSKRNTTYQKIINILAEKQLSQIEIINELQAARSGNFSEYLNDLEKSGFISKEHSWSLSTGTELKSSRYRIADNYLRFYLRYIRPNRARIINGSYHDIDLEELPNWHTLLGLQFENLVLNNRSKLKSILGVKNTSIVYDGPYFQTKTARRQSCQVDYMIQTRSNNIYICEIKFSKNTVRVGVIEEVQKKIDKLKLPKGFSCRPVLIHINGVENAINNSDFFAQIVDFGEFFEGA